MTISAKDLYELLPAVHRVRDASRGYPLQALLAVLAEQADVVAQDIDGLYANWFIETCDDWVIPYIGDLLRVRRLNPTAAGGNERSYVANTLGYRRRKGTVSVIERLAYDVTGWRAKAVESFHILGATQNVNHLRLRCLRTPDLRDASQLELLGGPFESAAHTVEVRRIEPKRGRYNIPDVEIMLWRLQAYPVVAATAQAVFGAPPGRYTFNPLGLDEPLFNQPKSEPDLGHLAGEIDVPGPLRPRALHDDLALPLANRQYFAPGQEVLAVGRLATVGGQPTWQQSDNLSICDLSDWGQPTWKPPPAGKIAVDVARGRLAFNGAEIPIGVSVSYAYGFSADVGAGPYSRNGSMPSWFDDPHTWRVGVIQDAAARQNAPDPQRVFATLSAAVAAWNQLPPGMAGVICVMDSCTYTDPVPTIVLRGGSKLAIVAAFSPGLLKSGETEAVEPEGLMPVVDANFNVSGTTPPAGKGAGELELNGLLIDGILSVRPGDLGRLRLASSTLLGALGVATFGSAGQRNERLQIEISSCLCGPISVPGSIGGVAVSDSVVDAGGLSAFNTATCDLEVNTTTVFGTTSARTMSASNCIFAGQLQVARVQAGCVRFSYVPGGSTVPKAFHCQPALALANAAASDAAAIRARMTPVFTSTRLGDPGYAQLSLLTAREVLTGGDNGAEMGVFNQVQQPQREANLRAALDEYMRFGLEAGIFYVN